MLAKRIIPCLDVMDNQVVKGVNFKNLSQVGDPLQLAKKYDQQKADELVFLDISATNEKRHLQLELATKLARNIFIPFAIGGGLNNLKDIIALVKTGADKVVINSAAFKNPKLITQAAKELGSQCIVVAIDIKHNSTFHEVFINAGKTPTGVEASEWAKQVEQAGAGEIILTSMDRDGTKAGFDLAITHQISTSLSIPLIASGGVGELQHFLEGFTKASADGALAASVLHSGKFSIMDIKAYLNSHNIPVRL